PTPSSLEVNHVGASLASPRRQWRERKRNLRPTGCAPPPPSSPPPFLARRGAQGETKPIKRKTISARDKDVGRTQTSGANNDGETGRTLQEKAQTCGSRSKHDRAAHAIPPPTDSPPFTASPAGGGEGEESVIQRRQNDTVSRLPRGRRRNNLRSAKGGRERCNLNDDDSGNGTTCSDFSCTSTTRRNSNVRGRLYSSGNNSSTSDGMCEGVKMYVGIDGLQRLRSGGKGKESGRSSRGPRARHRNRETSSRDDKQLVRCRNGTRGMTLISNTRNLTGRKKLATDERTSEGARRCARIHSSENKSLELSICRRDSPSTYITRRDKARGSETTATPSPRDTLAGCGGSAAEESPVNDGMRGDISWLAASSTTSYGGEDGDGIDGIGRSGTMASHATMVPRESTKVSLGARTGVADGNHVPDTLGPEAACSRQASGAGGICNDSVVSRALLRSLDKARSPRVGRSSDFKRRDDSAVGKKNLGVAEYVDTRQPGRRSPGRRKTTHSSNRRSGSRRRDNGLRTEKTPPRRRSCSVDENVPSLRAGVKGYMQDGKATADEDHDNVGGDVEGCNNANANSPRADERSPATMTRTYGTQSPILSTGGWFEVPGQGGRRAESKMCDDDDGGIEGAEAGSCESFSDNIVSSKRRYHDKTKGGTQRGSGDEGRNEDGSSERRRGGSCWGGSSEGGQTPARCDSLLLSFERGRNSALVQCVIVRDRSGMNRLYPQYSFFFEGRGEQLMMVAQKCGKNRTSNYHVFDMKRGGFRSRLNKKNGNYLGKVRTNLKRTEATIFTNEQEIAQLGALSFDKPGIVDHLRDGSQPRKFSVLLPALDCDGAPAAHKVDPYDADSDMLSCMKQGRHGNMFLLQSREPTYTNGNYRLNFHGRVTVPSVKNFQLVSPDDLLHTVCQFGKVGEDRFHLDYRAPINAFQAFCISLAQFNF
ncbi:unnamed protein product, partial [Scytosiphon promiscuus]